MGWGTWNLFGCFGVEHNWTEIDIRQMADALVSTGLAKCGYNYVRPLQQLPVTFAQTVTPELWTYDMQVNLDAGWQEGRDPKTGRPIESAQRFPNGIKSLIDYVHGKGLRFGWVVCGCFQLLSDFFAL